MASGDDYTTLWLPNSHLRQEATIPSTSLAALDAVRGYMVPQYVDRLPDGRRVAQLYRNDIQRIADGYGCAECLAKFEQRFKNCPSCGHELEPNRDIVDWNPAYWQPDKGRTSAEILADRKPIKD